MVLRADVVGNVGGINIVWKRQDGRPIPSRHVQVSKRLLTTLRTETLSLLFRETACCTSAGPPGRTPATTSARESTLAAPPSSRWVSSNIADHLFQFVANLVIAEALQIKLEPQQQTVSVTFLSACEGIFSAVDTDMYVYR